MNDSGVLYMLLGEPLMWLMLVFWPVAAVIAHLRGKSDVVPAMVVSACVWVPVTIAYECLLKGRCHLLPWELAFGAAVMISAVGFSRGMRIGPRTGDRPHWTRGDTLKVTLMVLAFLAWYVPYLVSLRR